jgi:hypothetical protein
LPQLPKHFNKQILKQRSELRLMLIIFNVTRCQFINESCVLEILSILLVAFWSEWNLLLLRMWHSRIFLIQTVRWQGTHTTPKTLNSYDLTLNQPGSGKCVKYQGPFCFDLAFTRCKLTSPGICVVFHRVLRFRKSAQNGAAPAIQ